MEMLFYLDMGCFTSNGSIGLSRYSYLIISGVEDSKIMFGYFSKVARLVVDVKNIKVPILLKASRKDRICLD